MSNLDIIQTFGICLLMACALAYRYKYNKEVKRRINQRFECNMNYQLINARYLNAIKELEATKAELEQYKNHQSEAYKLLSSEAKVSTSGGVMGGYAMLNVYEFAVVNKARYTFTLRGESYIGWGQEGNVIKALPMDATVSTPEILNEKIYIAFG